jgi:hypothetical protein
MPLRCQHSSENTVSSHSTASSLSCVGAFLQFLALEASPSSSQADKADLVADMYSLCSDPDQSALVFQAMRCEPQLFFTWTTSLCGT